MASTTITRNVPQITARSRRSHRVDPLVLIPSFLTSGACRSGSIWTQPAGRHSPSFPREVPVRHLPRCTVRHKILRSYRVSSFLLDRHAIHRRSLSPFSWSFVHSLLMVRGRRSRLAWSPAPTRQSAGLLSRSARHKPNRGASSPVSSCWHSRYRGKPFGAGGRACSNSCLTPRETNANLSHRFQRREPWPGINPWRLQPMCLVGWAKAAPMVRLIRATGSAVPTHAARLGRRN
jgi:hypothetical protein